MEQIYTKAEQESAIKTETTVSSTANSASVSDSAQANSDQILSQEHTSTEDSATPCESDSADDLLEKACNEFQNFSGVLFQNREMLYKALAYAYRYSRDVSNEELKRKATERGVKVGEIADCRDKNRIVIELVCQRAAKKYPNLPDRKKIYRMLLNRLWDEDLSFEEVVDRLNSEGIEKIARGKERSSSPLSTQNDAEIGDSSEDNNITEEQKIIMDTLFDNNEKNGIKAKNCILWVSRGEVRYITREDILKDFEEFLSSANGEPYEVLIEAPSD